MDITDSGSPVELHIKGVPAGKATLTQYMIDHDHSNAYTVWKKMGSPQDPADAQVAILEKAGQLETLSEPQEITIPDDGAVIKMQLPRQAVSLVKISY
jgi:xylan 1,4-beta-xylosidase